MYDDTGAFRISGQHSKMLRSGFDTASIRTTPALKRVRSEGELNLN